MTFDQYLLLRDFPLVRLGRNKSGFIIDAKDIGSVAAKVITEPQNHVNKSYELTNKETLTFTEMAEKISKVIGRTIKFVSPNLL